MAGAASALRDASRSHVHVWSLWRGIYWNYPIGKLANLAEVQQLQRVAPHANAKCRYMPTHNAPRIHADIFVPHISILISSIR
jgi:hypothetical protein